MVKYFSYQRNSKNEPVTVKSASPENQTSAKKIHKPKLAPYDAKNRFISAEKKMKGMKISITTKIDALQLLPYSFSADKMGSFFADELANTNMSENSETWKLFHSKIMLKAQNLPLVVLNHKEIFSQVLSLFSEKSMEISTLKLVFALIRDTREYSFQPMVEFGLEKMASIMLTNELAFEKVLVVLGAFIRNCFVKICSNVPIFLAKIIQICFDFHSQKQILRVFAELAAFLYKRTNDSSKKAEIIGVFFTEISLLEIESFSQKERNLIYFCSCFVFEMFKNFQANLENNFEQNLVEIVQNFERLIDNSLLEKKTSMKLIFSKLFRVLNFKFMKAELKFNLKKVSEGEKNIFSLICCLFGIKKVQFVTDTIADLLIDRILYKNSATFLQNYEKFSFEFFKTENFDCQKKALFGVLLVQKIDAKNKSGFFESFVSFNELSDFLNELIFMLILESQNESLALEKHILVNEKPSFFTNFKVDVFEKLTEKWIEFSHFWHSIEPTVIFKGFLMLDFIAKTNSIENYGYSFSSFNEPHLLSLFNVNLDQICLLGFFIVLSKSKSELSLKFINSNFSFLWNLSKELSHKLEFLNAESFNFEKLNHFQILTFFDSNFNPEFQISMETFSIFLKTVHNIPKSDSPKTQKAVQLWNSLSSQVYLHSSFILTSSKLSLNALFQNPNLFKNLPFSLLSRDSNMRLQILTDLTLKTDIDVSFQGISFFKFLAEVI